MAKGMGFNLGMAICEAFGLPAHDIGSLALRIDPGEAAMLDVQYYVPSEGAEGLEKVLKRYRLEEIDEWRTGSFVSEEVAGG